MYAGDGKIYSHPMYGRVKISHTFKSMGKTYAQITKMENYPSVIETAIVPSSSLYVSAKK